MEDAAAVHVLFMSELVAGVGNNGKAKSRADPRSPPCAAVAFARWEFAKSSTDSYVALRLPEDVSKYRRVLLGNEGRCHKTRFVEQYDVVFQK